MPWQVRWGLAPLRESRRRMAGALLGGWLGQHLGLRWALGFAGASALLLALAAWRSPVLRAVTTLPQLADEAGEPPEPAEAMLP